ncbi:hypothetical protein [Burkholderia stabilis]|uniref:hypothetical protein n=1 Tax=Burkholderia stabilis TaxID=95485 RepID=UPI001F4A7FA6|nr:hypothetical protein [Burkholderia stabilis]
MLDHSNSSPDSFPAVRGGRTGGNTGYTRERRGVHLRITRARRNTFLSAGAMV